MAGIENMAGLADTAEETAAMAEMQDGAAPDPAPAAPTPAPPASGEPAAPAIAPPAAAAEPAPVVDPATAQPPAPAAPATPEKAKFVPHAALHEERTRRQALERELADLRAGKTPQQQPDEIDPETDPIAALKEVRAFQKQQREQGEQAQQIREFAGRVQTHEADWAAANPDYGDQIAFLRESRATELMALPGMTQDRIGQQLMQEALQTADMAFRNGKNPGEVFTALALTRGWKAKEAPQPAVPAPTPPAPAPAVPQSVMPTPAEKIEGLRRGQAAAVSPSKGGGEAPMAGDISLEQLAGLDGDEFDKAFDKHGPRIFGS